jgi:hypothetical protein
MSMLHAARKSIERPRINPCACRQDWCNSLRKEIIEIAPEGHLWRKGTKGNGLYQLRNRANNRNDVRTAALKGSAVIHLKVSAEDAEKDSLQFALHHWHEVEDIWAAPFDSEAKAIERDGELYAGYKRYANKRNQC